MIVSQVRSATGHRDYANRSFTGSSPSRLVQAAPLVVADRLPLS